MKLLILAVVVTYVAATPLIGSNKCTWGPGYWCSHVSHAKECGAMGHCMETVWPKQQVNTKPTASCTVCKLAFGEMRNSMKNHAKPKDVLNFIAGFCTVLPSEEKQKCKAMMGDMPEIMQLVDSDISTEVLCSAIDLCQEDVTVESPKATTTRAPATSTTKSPSTKAPSKMCTDCKNLVQDLKDQLTDNRTAEDIIVALEQVVCAKMGPLQSMCNNLVEKYVREYLRVLANFLQPGQICTAISMCQNGDPFEMNMMLHKELMTEMFSLVKDVPASSESCQVCKTFVGDLRNLISDTSVQSEIESVLEKNVCSKFGSLSDTCKQYIEQYGGIVFEALTAMMDPETLCSKIGLCSQTADLTGAILSPENMLVKLQPAKLPDDNDMVKSEPTNTVASEVTPLCNLCKMLMEYIKADLKKNSTEEEIEAGLRKACSLLPGDLKNECDDLVSEYGPIILQLIISGVDFDEICSKIGLCSTQKTVAIQSPSSMFVLRPAKLLKGNDEVKSKPANAIVPVNALPCDLCKMLMEKVKAALSQNSTKEEIEAGLRKACSLLPGDLKNECDDLVSEYGPMIIEMIINGVDFDEICSKIGLCSTTKNDQHVISFPPHIYPREIHMIKWPGNKLYGFRLTGHYIDIVHPNTLAAKSGLKVGDIIIEVNGKNVESDSHEQISELIRDSTHEVRLLVLDPQSYDYYKTRGITVNSAMSGVQHLAVPLQEMEVGGGDSCLFCKLSVKYLKSFIQNKATRPSGGEEKLLTEFDHLCRLLPSSAAVKCTSLVSTYGPAFLDYLVSLPEGQICSFLNLCSAPATDNSMTPQVEENVCDMCTLVLTFAKDMLSNMTEDQLIQEMEQMCSVLPTQLQEDCKELVGLVGKYIADFILNADAHKTCVTLGLCSGIRETPYALPKGVECEMCSAVSTMVKKMFSGMTEDEIVQEFVKVCSFIPLPAGLKADCEKSMGAVGKTVADFILNVDPQVFCVDMGFCPATMKKPMLITMLKKPTLKKSIIECTVCKMVASGLDHLLQENATAVEIKKALDVVCGLIGPELSGECRNFTSKYEAVIITILVAELKPDKICATLKVCDPPSVQAQPSTKDNTLYFKHKMLGSKECSRGPDFWCASPENAKKCKAESYCIRAMAFKP